MIPHQGIIWTAKREKNAFEHAQNVQIQITLHMYKVSPGTLLSIHNSVVTDASVN